MSKKDERYIVETKPNSKEISKIIDTKSPKYHKPSGSQVPTLDDMLSIEFNFPMCLYLLLTHTRTLKNINVRL